MADHVHSDASSPSFSSVLVDARGPDQTERTSVSPPSVFHRLIHWFVPLLAGILDPFLGAAATFARLFWRAKLPARADTPQRRRRGLAIILGGIEGPSQYSTMMACGVLRSGFRGSVVRVDWNRGLFLLNCLRNLMSRRHHERWSDRVVGMIMGHLVAHPGTPVHLVAQSGGCWIAVRALEKLPAGVGVDRVVLLAAAISPGYDLSAAAARCGRGMVSVRGSGDFCFLGVGTTLFGTSDRVHTPSAGWLGFRRRPSGFAEWRWRPAWVRYGYFGNHVTTAAPELVRLTLVRESTLV